MMWKIPNLFIVGAAKAGTNFLWQLLRQHPDVFMTEDRLYKEPGYFSDLKGIKDRETYLNLFAKATTQKYIGEASTAYLTDPVSARRIYNFNPDAKIIILLRNPIHRAYSLYNWMVQEGYEYSRTFEIALAKEAKRKYRKIPNLFFEPEYYYNYLYFQSGLYVSQVRRYLEVFGRDRVFIGLFEELTEKTAPFLSNLQAWLGLTRQHLSLHQQINRSYQVRSSYLAFALRKLTSITRRVYHPQTKAQRDFLLRLARLDFPPPPIKLETYRMLYLQYQNEYQKLESDLGLNIDVWKEADRLFLQQG